MRLSPVLGLLAACGVAACDLPAATFGDTNGNGGSGAGNTSMGGMSSTTTNDGAGGVPAGGGGAGGATVTTTTTTTTTTTMFPGAQVSCTSAGLGCGLGKVCCFHENDGAFDHCGTEGDCCTDPAAPVPCSESEYVILKCNDNADCQTGVCCGYIDTDTNAVLGMSCSTACGGAGEIEVCSGTAQCDPCTPLFMSAYPGYGYCQ